MDFVRWHNPSQALTAKDVSYPQLTATLVFFGLILEIGFLEISIDLHQAFIIERTFSRSGSTPQPMKPIWQDFLGLSIVILDRFW